MRTTTRTLATLVLAVSALAAGAAAHPVSAAAAGCWGRGPNVEQVPGALTWGTTWCRNYAGSRTVRGSGATGYLYAGTNWFVCQARHGENPRIGSARNHWWLWTQGDLGYRDRGWGWFPATHVSGGGNYEPIPGLRRCSWSDGLRW